MARGYSLIELVTSLGIVVLLLVWGIPAYRNFGAQRELALAAESVRETLLEAQNLALAPRAEKSSDAQTYGVVFPAGGSDYSLKEGATVIKNITLGSTNIVFDNAQNYPGGIEVVYSIAAAGQITAPANDVTITLKSTRLKSANARVLKIIRATGQILIGTS